MLRVIYNEYKGYCVPKGDNIGFEFQEIEDIRTDGFDKLDWASKEGEEDARINSFYDIYNKPLDEQEEDTSMYENESKVPMNPESTLDKHDLTEDESTRESKKSKKNKGLTKKERKEANRISTRKRATKNSRSTFEDLYNGQSDPKKVTILKKLYGEIISRFEKGLKMDDKLCQFFDISIYKEDIEDLKDEEWLSDNNISFIYEYLERYQLSRFDNLISTSIQLIRPSMVYLLANMPDPKELKGVIPPIENSKFLFLPVNDNDDVSDARAGSHWSLVVVSLLDKTCFIYDTMDRANEKEAKQVIRKVSEYLGIKFQTKIMNDTPQQINGSDCGIMVCQLTAFLLSRLLDLDHIRRHYINFDVNRLTVSAIDGRIFVMGTILNILKHKQDNE